MPAAASCHFVCINIISTGISIGLSVAGTLFAVASPGFYIVGQRRDETGEGEGEGVIVHAFHLFVLDPFGWRSNASTLGSVPRGAAQPGAPLHYIMLPTRTRSMERPQNVSEQTTSPPLRLTR
jgi:hypothetical protein